jgi:plastocyanin
VIIGSGGIHGSQRSHRSGRHTSIVLASAVALLASGLAAPATAQADLTITAGVGDGTVAGQAYMPGAFTVAVGDSVAFTIGSDDPHTITFGEGPADVPSDAWPVSGWEAPPADAPPPYDLGTTTYDGTGFVNSAILFGKGSVGTIEFTAAGTFPFFCAIHPGMAGEVTVVEDGPVTTQEEADAAKEATSDLLLAAVEPSREERAAAVSVDENADGTSTHNAFADAGTETMPLPGGGTGHLELLEFTPAQIAIDPGDTINWSADRAHSITFIPEGTDPMSVFESFEAAFRPIPGDSYDGSEPRHSGVLNFPSPDGQMVSEYSLTFPVEGVYPYFCILHVELGQVGVVAVGVPLPEPAG